MSVGSDQRLRPGTVVVALESWDFARIARGDPLLLVEYPADQPHEAVRWRVMTATGNLITISWGDATVAVQVLPRGGTTSLPTDEVSLELLTLDELNMLLTTADRVVPRGPPANTETRKGTYLTVYKGLSFKTFFIGYAVDHNAVIVEKVG